MWSRRQPLGPELGQAQPEPKVPRDSIQITSNRKKKESRIVIYFGSVEIWESATNDEKTEKEPLVD